MIRYRKLGYVGLNVSDVVRSRQFYEDVVGLEFVEEAPDGSVRFRCSDDYWSVALHPSQSPGFRYVGYMLEDASQYEFLEERLHQNGIPYEVLSGAECADRRVESGWRISAPHLQAAFEFYRPRPEDTGTVFKPSCVNIRGLGHVVFATPHYKAVANWMGDVLNFAPSDHIEHGISFFRLFPNPYHHGVGVGIGAANTLHHLNFMVSSIDDIGAALHRLKRHDVPVVFGPGRHPASTSVFLYYLEPDQITLEYSFGMEEFSEVDPRAPRILPPVAESIDSWGAERDVRMSASGAIEPYRVGIGWADPEEAMANASQRVSNPTREG